MVMKTTHKGLFVKMAQGVDGAYDFTSIQVVAVPFLVMKTAALKRGKNKDALV